MHDVVKGELVVMTSTRRTRVERRKERFFKVLEGVQERNKGSKWNRGNVWWRWRCRPLDFVGNYSICRSRIAARRSPYKAWWRPRIGGGLMSDQLVIISLESCTGGVGLSVAITSCSTAVDATVALARRGCC